MPDLPEVRAIWYMSLTAGDFYNIERARDTQPGGGGQSYIDLPGEPRTALFRFLGLREPPVEGEPPRYTYEFSVLTAPEIASPLTFAPNRAGDPRYRIVGQKRQSDRSERHPAWTEAYGFPMAPDDVGDRDEAARHLPEGGLRLVFVKTADGRLYAYFVQGTDYPEGWPDFPELHLLFNPDAPGAGVIEVPSASTLGDEVLESWRRSPNVLLYGPPGTGKTHAMGELWEHIGADIAPLVLDTDDPLAPFKTEFAFERPVHKDWVTFHQNSSYEDFILGLRPTSAEGGGIELRPRAGRLLDLVARLDREGGTGFLFIDEINRANVGRVFGELITFLDREYRGGVIPVPLPTLNIHEEMTEAIDSPSGGHFNLEMPWPFPEQFFIVASMNSVDRSAAPLDAALSRRFQRIWVEPDLDFLAEAIGIERDHVEDRLRENDPLEPLECAWALLRYLNQQIAAELGMDFEIGHTPLLVLPLDGDAESQYRVLATIWDQQLFPALADRYAARPRQLSEVLRLDMQENLAEDYAFSVDERGRGLVRPAKMSRLDHESRAASLHFLATGYALQ